MGPLHDVTVIELAGIGPGPFCGMMLADMGATVIRVDRPGTRNRRGDVSSRGKRSIVVDLKQPDGVDAVLELCRNADALIEGFRPGVTERLGIGPDACLAANPALVYGRMTGWGQEGPLASAAGHDINYIALAGALHSIGPTGGKPVPPINLVGDYGGGGMLLAFGVLAAIIEARGSGAGQVVDAAMVDGTAALMSVFHGQLATGSFDPAPGAARLTGGAHEYNVYETSDAKFVCIGSLEPQFYALLVDLLGLGDDERFVARSQDDWPELKEQLTQIFSTRTRDEWCDLMEGTDICFAPVLALDEVPDHPHNAARDAYVDHDGFVQPAPAPRLSRTPGAIAGPAPTIGGDTEAVLRDCGVSDDRIAELLVRGVVGNAT